MSKQIFVRQTEPAQPTISKQLVSLNSEKLELKKVETEINLIENRILMLKQQEKKQRKSLELNKAQTQLILEKKAEVGQIQKLKERDNSKDIERAELLKRRNQQLRVEHQRQINQILQACYLVKLDEAREIKNLSMVHDKKIKQLKGETVETNRQKGARGREREHQSKVRYVEYWKGKLTKLYENREQSSEQVAKLKEEKAQYLEKLHEQEDRLLRRVKKLHTHSLEAKKEYSAAMYIPIRELTIALHTDRAHSVNHKEQESQSSIIHHKLIQPSQIKLPNTNLNSAKLRTVLKQLKKHGQRETANQ